MYLSTELYLCKIDSDFSKQKSIFLFFSVFLFHVSDIFKFLPTGMPSTFPCVISMFRPGGKFCENIRPLDGMLQLM